MFKKTYLLLAINILLSLICCKKSNDTASTPVNLETPVGMLKIAETYITGAGVKAIIYSDKSLLTGYNNLYTAIYDSIDGSIVNNGLIEMQALFIQGKDTIYAPVENQEDTLANNHLFHSSIIIPVIENINSWKLTLRFQNFKNSKSGTNTIGSIPVTNPAYTTIKSQMFYTQDSAQYLICLVQPNNAKTGLNDLDLTIHRLNTNHKYEPSAEFTVTIKPIMISMGHSSPNNVNPIFTQKGHYTGKVNFTMSGLWRINLAILKDVQMVSDSLFFDTNLTY